MFDKDLLERLGAEPVAPTPEYLANKAALEAGSKASQSLNAPTPNSPEGKLDNTVRRLDTDDGGIRHQKEQDTFDGSTYYEGGSKNPANQRMYESIGRPGPLGSRVQVIDEGKPTQSTKFVPTADEGQSSFVDRVVVGSFLEAAKGVGGLAEWIFDQVQEDSDARGKAGAPNYGPGALLSVIADKADEILKTKFSDHDVNYVQQNFATLPAQNELEAMAMEIGSMAIGGVGGQKLVEKGVQLSSRHGGAIAKSIDWFFGKAKEVDVKNAPAKLNAFIMSLLAELGGAGIGATVTAPSEAQSLSGEGLKTPWGDVPQILPEEIPGQDANERNKIGHLVDNTGLSLIGKGIFSVGGALMKKVNQIVPWKTSSKPRREAELLVESLKAIDPDLKGLTDEEFSRRAQIFADTVSENSKFNLEALEHSHTRSTINSVIIGAEDYVEKAYAFTKETLSPEEWKEFSRVKVEEISNNVAHLRRANMGNTAVQAADAITMRNAEDTLSKTFERLGGDQAVSDTGQAIGGRQLGRINESQQAADMAAEQARLSRGSLDRAQAEGNVVRDLAGPRDPLGSTRDIDAEMAELTGPTLYNATNRSIQETDALFKAIPEGVEYDREALADVIINSGNARSILEDLNIVAPSNPVRPTHVGDAADTALDPSKAEGLDLAKLTFKTTEEGVEELTESGRDYLIKQLEDIDLKTLYNNARPALSKMMDEMTQRAAPGASTAPLNEIKRFIDEAAEAHPAFEEAMTSYRTDMEMLGGFDEFKDYRENVRSNEASTVDKNVGDVYEQGHNLTQRALNDPTGRRLEVVTNLLNRYDAENSEQLGSLLLAEAAREISTKAVDGVVSADIMKNALAPRLRGLEATNGPAYARYKKIVADLEAAEVGSKEADAAMKNAIDFANTERKAALEHIGGKFLVEHDTAGLVVGGLGDITKASNNIFRNEGNTTRLLAAAAEEGPEVLEGVQAQYVSWLRDKATTSTNISGAGDHAVQGSSGSNLYRMLNSSDKTDAEVLKKVFADKPDFLNDITYLLQEMQYDSFARQLKPQTFSSNTAIDYSKKQALNALTTFAFGTLSRPGAMIRNIISNVSSAENAVFNAQAEEFLGAILADSAHFSEMVESIAKREPQGRMAMAEKYVGEVLGLAKGNTQRAITKTVLEKTEEAPDVKPTKVDTETEDAFGRVTQAPFLGPPKAPGLTERGNLDLNDRKVLKNDDGSISTERSFSFEEDGKEVLIPTVVNGKLLSEDEAIKHYQRTGEHLGKFNDPASAEAYADFLHNRQDRHYNQGN